MGNKKVLSLAFVLLLVGVSSVQACGWFTYEDIPDTRVYYDFSDTIEGIEDGVLLMSRFPTEKEIEKNVFIPENYIGGYS